MMEFKVKGGFGDTYLVALCKLYHANSPLRIMHYAKFHDRCAIQDIYGLNPKVSKVEFVTREVFERFPLKEINVTYKDHSEAWPLEPYPQVDFSKVNVVKFGFPDHYSVVQVNSGTRGSNAKALGKQRVLHQCTVIIQESLRVGYKIVPVLVGTDESYRSWVFSNTINLVGRTSLLEAMKVVAEADTFVGPEGLLFYVALSHRVPAIGYALPGKLQSPLIRCAPEWGAKTKVHSL